jgi:hypothetical protein
MEEHFLKDFVSGHSRLAPEPWYNPDGDCIIYQIVDEAVVADRIDEVLTIYRSAITNNPIGYQIKGVGAITKALGVDGIQVESRESEQGLLSVSIHALLLAAYDRGPKTIHRRMAYADAFESLSPTHPRVQIGELAQA